MQCVAVIRDPVFVAYKFLSMYEKSDVRLAKFELSFFQESQDPKEQKEETPALSGPCGVASWWTEIGHFEV